MSVLIGYVTGCDWFLTGPDWSLSSTNHQHIRRPRTRHPTWTWQQPCGTTVGSRKQARGERIRYARHFLNILLFLSLLLVVYSTTHKIECPGSILGLVDSLMLPPPLPSTKSSVSARLVMCGPGSAWKPRLRLNEFQARALSPKPSRLVPGSGLSRGSWVQNLK